MTDKLPVRRRSVLGAIGTSAAAPTLAQSARGDEDTRRLAIEGQGKTAHYEITVSGSIEKSDDGTINSYDSITDTTVTGRTTEEPDAYRYSGSITNLSVDNPVLLTIEGIDESDEASEGEADILTIEGQGETAHYEFAVSEDVEKSEAYDGTINDYDTVDSNTVTGRTTEEPDSYAFVGEIVGFDADAPVTTRLNGAPISLGQSDDPEPETPNSTDTESGLPEPPSDFNNVVDIVEAGADPNGNDNILPVLEDAAGDDTLIQFPSGEYLIDGTLRLTNYEKFGMVGDDATIRVAPTNDYVFKLGTYRSPIDDLYVEGFTADISGDDTGGRVFELQAESSLTARNITVTGEHDTSSKGPMLAGLRDSDGEGLVENIDLSDGGVDVSGGRGGTGLLVSNYHEGSITLRNIDVGPFPDNGIYCSNSEGTVSVEDSRAVNTNVAGVRLDGDEASVTGSEFIYDTEIEGYDGQRPIRLDGGDCRVADCDITMSIPQTEAIRVMPECESAVIEDVRMDLTDAVRDAISITSGAGPVDVTNLDASGYDRYEVYEY